MTDRLFTPLKQAFAKIRSMWKLLGEYEDITDQVTLLNGWTDQYNCFRVLKVPGGLIITGMLKSGAVSLNTRIAYLPNLGFEERAYYTYGIAQDLSKHTTSLFSIRNRYIAIDNNLPFDGTSGHLFALNAFVPLANYTLGGVLHSRYFLRKVAVA